MNASQEFARVKGLGNVVVRAHFKTHDPVDVFAAGGEHQNGSGVFSGAQAPQDLQAVFARHHEIQHQRVKAFAQPQPIHVLGAVGNIHRKAVFAEVAAQKVAKTGIVVNDQYFRQPFRYRIVGRFFRHLFRWFIRCFFSSNGFCRFGDVSRCRHVFVFLRIGHGELQSHVISTGETVARPRLV